MKCDGEITWTGWKTRDIHKKTGILFADQN